MLMWRLSEVELEQVSIEVRPLLGYEPNSFFRLADQSIRLLNQEHLHFIHGKYQIGEFQEK